MTFSALHQSSRYEHTFNADKYSQRQQIALKNQFQNYKCAHTPKTDSDSLRTESQRKCTNIEHILSVTTVVVCHWMCISIEIYYLHNMRIYAYPDCIMRLSLVPMVHNHIILQTNREKKKQHWKEHTHTSHIRLMLQTRMVTLLVRVNNRSRLSFTLCFPSYLHSKFILLFNSEILNQFIYIMHTEWDEKRKTEMDWDTLR